MSVVIAGLTLVLANTAKAGTLQKNATVDAISTQALQAPPALLKPVAGGLYIGGGCDQESVVAVERDWRVKIDNYATEVRVMQTFLMPADGPTVAFFLSYFAAEGQPNRAHSAYATKNIERKSISHG